MQPIEIYTLSLCGVLMLVHVATSKQHPLICIWEIYQPMLALIASFVVELPMAVIEALYLPEFLVDVRALSAYLHSKL